MHEIKSRYLSLETYRRDGTPVCTPVWFVSRNDCIYVITRDKTGKAKRLRNNSKVRVAACSMRGMVRGEWCEGIAEFVAPEETSSVIVWRDEKYGVLSRLAKFLSRGRGELVALAITLR